MSTGIDQSRFNLFSFHGKTKTLHLAWFAFFLSFAMWFNHAPLLFSIQESLGLTDEQIKVILILNVALTIPARIIIGMLVDRFGPRIMFSLLLAISSFLCFLFAGAETFERLALYRFLLGFVGAGFVIGIRLVAEWFPAKQVGTAEGIYGGWGNFGSAFAAMSLPLLALYFGGENGWRYAVATTGVLGLIFSFVFYFTVTDNPKGTTYFKPKQLGAMEVTSKGDFYLYCLMSLPLYLTLALLVWKLSPDNVRLLNWTESYTLYLSLGVLYLYQLFQIYRVNSKLFEQKNGPTAQIHRYHFKQVAILDLSYMVTFGSELAVVSMLPLFFKDTFGLTQTTAGLLASGFALMNLVARPGGGMISDRFGRRMTMMVFLGGLIVGYALMAQINSSWPLALAVLVTMGCSFFVQAGEGAVFAMVPLVKRRLTGQVAGMAGAYGNVGAVAFLTTFSFVSPTYFFYTISLSATVTAVAVFFFLEEPKGYMVEEQPDGTLERISMT